MARIIRHDTDSPPIAEETAAPSRKGPRILRRETTAAEAEAEAIVQAAQREAAELLAAARNEAEVLRQQTEAKAIATGASEAAKLLASAQAESTKLLAGAEASLAPVVLMACERLFREQIAVEPSRMHSILEGLLLRCRRDLHRVVRVHPEDLPAVAPLAGPLLELRGDPTLERGDCIVSSAEGHFDARLSAQLEAIGKALMP